MLKTESLLAILYGYQNSIEFNDTESLQMVASVTNVLQSIRIVYEFFKNMLKILFPCEF